MGVFATHEKQNMETITTEYIDYIEYTIQVDLIEYDLYERILVFRDTYRKEGIRIQAFHHDPRDDYDPFVHDLRPVTKEVYAWRKEDGPSKSLFCEAEPREASRCDAKSLRFNLSHGLDEVQSVLDEKLDKKQRLRDAVEHAKECGFGD